MSTQVVSVGRSTASESETSYSDFLLRRAAMVYGIGFLIHNADHARRTIAASPEPVVWAGTAVAMLTTVIFTLIAVRHRHAPTVAAFGATLIAFGVAASHLLPKWGFLSDPLPGGNVDAWTWVAVLSEITGAIVLALVAFRVQKVRNQSKE
jgi:hypothetical protein